MKKVLCLLLIFVSIMSQAYAKKQGKEKIDSLLTVLKSAKEDTSKVNMLNDLSTECSSTGEYKEARKYADEALTLAEKIGFKTGIANSIYKIGIVYSALSDFTKALEYFQKSLAINEQV